MKDRFVMDTAFAQMLPPVASDIAGKWDVLFLFLVGASLFFFVIVVGALIWFVIKYREKEPGQKVGNIVHNEKLEFIWITIPTILVMIIFAWGWVVYKRMVDAPESAYDIKVIGKQWFWQFQYDNGKTTIGELIVPEKIPVRLVMTSDDVIHSFFLPDFRIKNDVVPGMYTKVWFQANEQGEHTIFCAEYCGEAHSKMMGTVKVVSLSEWENFKKGTGATKERPASLVDWGQQLYTDKGCFACHSIDGAKGIAPTFKGIWGKREEMSDGSFVLVDENYVRESIEYPGTSKDKLVKGFPPVMPTFKGLLTEEEMNAFIAFIKSLKE